MPENSTRIGLRRGAPKKFQNFKNKVKIYRFFLLISVFGAERREFFPRVSILDPWREPTENSTSIEYRVSVVGVECPTLCRKNYISQRQKSIKFL